MKQYMTREEGYLSMWRAGIACDDAEFPVWLRAQGPMTALRAPMACDSAKDWVRENELIRQNTIKFYGHHLAAHQRHLEQLLEQQPERISTMSYDDTMKYAIDRTKLLLALDMSASDLDAQAAQDGMRKAASKMSRYEWDGLYDHLGGMDTVTYHGHELPQNMPPRGRRTPYDSGNMEPRGSTTAHGSAMDSFVEMYGEPARVHPYGTSPSAAPVPTSSDIASFHEMYGT